MDAPLILQAIASSTMLFTLWKLSLQLFNVFHIEVGAVSKHLINMYVCTLLRSIEFPVVAKFGGEAPELLQNILKPRVCLCYRYVPVYLNKQFLVIIFSSPKN